MEEYRKYVLALDDLLRRAAIGDGGLASEIEHSLNGQASSELRRLIPLADLRRFGAFFTGTALAARVVERIRGSISSQSVICDPACGAGDLLLAGASCLPVGPTHPETMAQWARQLLGRDVHVEFVDAARRRLSLLAVSRGIGPLSAQSITPLVFERISAGCGLADVDLVSGATHILLNPPFGLVPAPTDCCWASGSVSEAAVFLEACVRRARPGTRIVAILPDVLRSGGRYGRWREFITNRAKLLAIDLVGQFDPLTDVDVFVADMVVGASSESATGFTAWMRPASDGVNCVSGHFEVSVGSVVAYRDVKMGPWVRYIQARGLPAWVELTDVVGRRRYRGRLHKPPFVVVRRTSRVGDRHRAVTTVVRGRHPVAVENHLIVLQPTDGRLATCQRAMAVFRLPETDDWLDQRIRCRHLTLASIREIPFTL